MTLIPLASMGDGAGAPAAAGLAVGAGLVLLFGLAFGDAIPIFSDFQKPLSNNVEIIIEIAKDEYQVGESIDFAVSIKGMISGCIAPPHAAISETTTGEVMWDSGFASIVCDPDAGIRPVDIEWRPSSAFVENGIRHSQHENIVAEKPGTFELIVEYAGIKESWIFVVT